MILCGKPISGASLDLADDSRYRWPQGESSESNAMSLYREA
jgi:hypothetical protein